MKTAIPHVTGRSMLWHVLLLAMTSTLLLSLSSTPVSAADQINVKLLDNGSPATGTLVDAFRENTDGSLSWYSVSTTNSDGQATLNAPDVGTLTYILRARLEGDGEFAYSDPVTSSSYTFNYDSADTSGELNVTLTDAGSGSLLTKWTIYVYKVTGSTSYVQYPRINTDSEGKASMRLPGLGNGTQYFLRALRKSDWKNYSSDILSTGGDYAFNVGGTSEFTSGGGSASSTTSSSDTASADSTASSSDSNLVSDNTTTGGSVLNVQLWDHVTQQAVPSLAVEVYELSSSGSRSWVDTKSTDGSGRVSFDLDGLLEGKTFVLGARPFDGAIRLSDEITSGGSYTFSFGGNAVYLTRGSDGQALAGKQVYIREKKADGSLPWYKTVTTDSKGYARWNLPVEEGRIFIAQVINPLGNNQRYYSDWILTTGITNFPIKPGETATISTLDLIPPVVSIKDPDPSAVVSHEGFVMDGYISDNIAVGKVELLVQDPIKGNSTVTATHDNGYWSASVDGSHLSANQTVVVTVTGYDKTLNEDSASRAFSVIEDNQYPTLSVVSHSSNDWILHNGFTLTGKVSDNATLKSLTATITDSQYGTLASNQAVEVSEETGSWTLVGGETSPGGTVTVLMRATDAAGNVQQNTTKLYTRPVTINGVQLANRATFGATPELYAEIAAMGPENWLEQQLSPSGISNTKLNTVLSGISVTSKPALQDYRMAQAIYNRRQLQEVMAEFWDNHFNTDVWKTHRVLSEKATNDYYRENAFGYFADLLETTAKSTTMLLFLDNAHNFAAEPNENYARELMELHTVGVDQHSQSDVVNAARVFTGWHVSQSGFTFYDKYHDDSAASVMGLNIPAGSGQKAGEMLLDYLATHPDTATFMCHKLAVKFVRDNPPASLVSGCASKWLSSGGHMGTVVEYILRSPAFNSVDNEHVKVKDPMEIIAGMVRNYEANINWEGTRRTMRNMGMTIAGRPSADSYPEVGRAWANSNMTLQILSTTNELINNPWIPTNTLNSMVDFFGNRGYETAEGIVGFLFSFALANDYSDEEWEQALGVLTDDGSRPFLLSNDDAEDRIRLLIHLVAGYPSYQLQ